MPRRKLPAKLLLWPLSRVYGLVVSVRNMLYARGVLKSERAALPTVVVGNLAIGGTGKTPHVEYLLETIGRDKRVAVLSRGYKRATKGFVLATPRSAPADLGDEAFQVYQKYGGDVMVAVCENRLEGVARIHELDPQVELVLLDDAFQHRSLRPDVSVVLTEYHRPAFNDSLLPYGHLREPVSAFNRADIVVVTKCPANLKPMEYRIFRETLNLFPYQRLYFSRFVYGHLEPVFPEAARNVPSLQGLTEADALLVVSGVANPRPFVRYLRHFEAKVRLSCYPDHHAFTHADIQAIADKFKAMKGVRRYIITTEKDAVRLSHNPYFPPELKALTYFLPVSVAFIDQASTPGSDPAFEAAIAKLLAKEAR